MNIDITQIIVAAIGVLGTVFAGLITTYLVPWLRSKLTASQLETISALVYNGVKAAETLYTESGSGKKKFQYVMDSVKAFCEANHITFDEIVVKNQIQSVWKDLFSHDTSTENADAEKATYSKAVEPANASDVKPAEQDAKAPVSSAEASETASK